jgi:hypothetical protein
VYLGTGAIVKEVSLPSESSNVEEFEVTAIDSNNVIISTYTSLPRNNKVELESNTNIVRLNITITKTKRKNNGETEKPKNVKLSIVGCLEQEITTTTQSTTTSSVKCLIPTGMADGTVETVDIEFSSIKAGLSKDSVRMNADSFWSPEKNDKEPKINIFFNGK